AARRVARHLGPHPVTAPPAPSRRGSLAGAGRAGAAAGGAVTMAGSDRVLARLMQLHPKLIDLSLGRIERLLAALGNPHERLPPAVHVAGTNGKGSTLATLRASLEAGRQGGCA